MSSQVKAQDHAGLNGSAAQEAPQPDSLANATEKDAAEAEALQAKLQSNENAGARVMSFDEDASPEQKAAEAKRLANEKVKPKAPAQDSKDAGLGEYDPEAYVLGPREHAGLTYRMHLLPLT